MTARRFILSHHRSPGDIVVMTALVRDIHLSYPGQFEIAVKTSAADVWKHNPHVVPAAELAGKHPQMVRLDYGAGIREQNHATVHFLSYFHKDFNKRTGLDVKVHKPYGDLHLSEEERTAPLVSGRYWIVISGGKSDATVKVWDAQKFQAVVSQLRARGLGVVQIGSTDSGHWHPPMDGALNLVGRTDLRDMMRLIYHADGVVCGVTAAMHMAAALERPCVVLAGGREAWWWEAYVPQNTGFGGPEIAQGLRVPHKFLHTIGVLACCRNHGCWKNKTVPINDDKSLCYWPVTHSHQPVPKCLDLITPHHVMEGIMQYYTDGTLPPIRLLTADGQPASPEELGITSQPPVLLHEPNGRIKKVTSTVLRPAATKTSPPAEPPLPESLFDHPDVGGKYTVCVLFYGPESHFEMHRRCLEGILNSTPADRVDIRVASNELNPQSLALIAKHQETGRISKHYRHETNDYKYPIMREMFFDPGLPITTKWVVWFDDDSIVRDEKWLLRLSHSISQYHRRDNAHMFGSKFVFPLAEGQKQVFRKRPWFRNKLWRLRSGKPSPTGNTSHFCAGGWWALTHEAIVKADIPDLGTGLTHNGGDWQIGEQLYQAGYSIKLFNNNKQYIHTSSSPRRGVTMPVPGAGKAITPQAIRPMARR